jgi:hypothetical protein
LSKAEILIGVLVLGAEADAGDVLVDVYGSSSNVCGSIRFTSAGQAEMLARLQAWAGAETPLTYVRRGRSVTLQDDASLYGGQLEPAP